MRLRHHVNPLRSDFLTRRVDRLELPDDPRLDVEVELGSAEGQFLFARAAPGRLLVGLEIREDLVGDVNRQAVAAGVAVRAVYANINVDLPHLFAPGSVARIFVNFPDPWFKRRHHKRRLVEPRMLAACHRALRPGGELFFQSDVWDLALDALAELEARPELFANRAGAWSFWKDGNPYGAVSRREEFCQEDGTPVWRMLYRRIDAISRSRAAGSRAP